MKIISCHIENFGKLHNYFVDFSDGANILCEENGWGKSTFTAFVRAMFYGLDGERKRSIEENERKRYKPWQGGVFGGQMVFEIDGKEYQVSRIFHDKEINDEFELRDFKTNLLSKDYSKNIGEEIFKINRESFMRTIFIGPRGCETSSTDDINAKIGDLAENSNDLNNFDSANRKLIEIMNGLNPGRVSGSISKRREEIARYERVVQDGQEIAASLDTYQGYLRAEEDTYESLKTKMQETGEQQTKVSKLQSAIAKKSEWQRLKKSVLVKKEEVDASRIKFPGDIPELEAVKTKISECGDMEKVLERVSLYQISEAEESELAKLMLTFAEGVPENSDIDAKIEMAGRFRSMNQEFSSEQMSSTEKERLKELEAFFANESENVAAVVEKWNNRNTKKATLPSNQAALTALKTSMTVQKPQEPKKISILMICGIILAILGVIAAIAVQAVVGIIIVVVGVVCFIVGMLGNKKVSEPVQQEDSPELEKIRRTIEEDIAFITNADEAVADYLNAHGKIFEEYTVSTVLQEIIAESVEYLSLKKKAQKSENSLQAADLEKMRRSINTFLSKYGVVSSDSGISDDLYALKNKAARYIQLKNKKENFRKAESGYNIINKSICVFLKKYGYEPKDMLLSQLNEIREAIDEYQNAMKVWEGAVGELERFEAETEVSMLNETYIEEDIPSLEELNQMVLQLTEDMEKVHNRIIGYNKTLDELQEKYDEWEESRLKLDELKALQAEEQKKYDCVYMAHIKLGLAKDAMMSKYADPILEGFCKYFKMISGNNADIFHIDANTNVTVDEFGKQRETNALSSGYRDLIGFCLRIALVDAMYQEEAPVLIMDDPFTNLDDRKMNAGRDFLKKIAEKYQIIYFTCSNTRS